MHDLASLGLEHLVLFLPLKYTHFPLQEPGQRAALLLHPKQAALALSTHTTPQLPAMQHLPPLVTVIKCYSDKKSLPVATPKL